MLPPLYSASVPAKACDSFVALIFSAVALCSEWGTVRCFLLHFVLELLCLNAVGSLVWWFCLHLGTSAHVSVLQEIQDHMHVSD